MRVALLDRPRSRTSGTVTPASRHFSGRSAQKVHAAKGQHLSGAALTDSTHLSVRLDDRRLRAYRASVTTVTRAPTRP